MFAREGGDTMILRQVVERFERDAPISVMARAAMENILSADRLNGLFEEAAQLQENRTLMFSTVADIMGLVACRIHPSVHAAYQAKKEEVGVTAKALYDKLQRMEGNVSRRLVRETASRMGEIIRKTKGTVTELMPGYRVKIIDGNHLRRTQRRIKELSQLNAAPLPGHCLVVLDPRLRLAIDVVPCEDAHAQERSLLPEVLQTVERGDLWIADRNFCTTGFLFGVMARRAHFVSRQHAQSLRYELVGKRKKVGRSETGIVYEQSMRIFDRQGKERIIRRITVELYEPTRDKETEIHILTNLPKKISALKIAKLYQKRWTIETAFQEIAQNLEGEIETLGYPRAALFAFSMALVSYNVISVILAALRAAHGEATVNEEVSIYYLCDEVAATYRGLAIAVDAAYWSKNYATLTPVRLARELVRIAEHVKLSRYRKHKRGPKKPVEPMDKKRRNHVSTARVLAKRCPQFSTS
jgi:IS4 transposase